MYNPQILKTISNLGNSIPHITQEPITVPVLKLKISISELKQKIHVGINLQRQNQGLKPLVYYEKIDDVANAHSQDIG